MHGPDELVHIRAELEQREAHQRGGRQVEPLLPIGLQVPGEARALLVRPGVAPRRAGHLQVGLLVDHLYRLVQVLPEERRAQDGVALGDMPPGALEGAQVQRTGQPQAHLQDVDA